MRRTKIVCTIGPASESPQMLRGLLEAGMDVARLNLSHGDQAWHAGMVARIRQVAAEAGQPIGILWDLSGPKLRVGKMAEGGVRLQPTTEVTLTTRPIVGHDGEVPVQYGSLPQHVTPGERILLDDGLLELQVLEAASTEIRCRVIVGGVLDSNKGMNLPSASLAIPAITAKDRDDLRFGLGLGVDWVALSFVRTADDVRELKRLIAEHDGEQAPTPVISKIEKPEAVTNIDSLIEVSDGIMVARGDLGIETSPEQVPIVQKKIIAACNAVGKPVITATQMLDSMIRNPRPTRAEASDVANAILDGTDAVMLSGETAAGQYPLESARTMANIVQYAEQQMPQIPCHYRPPRPRGCSIAEAVSHASTETADDLNAAAIITPTVSGYTARRVAQYRPQAPIVAVTPDPVTQQRMTLYWGVCPLLAKRTDNTDEMTASAVRAALEHDWVKNGDTVVITGSTAGSRPGTTNIIAVRVVGDGAAGECVIRDA
jgi:pyruvate kinase